MSDDEFDIGEINERMHEIAKLNWERMQIMMEPYQHKTEVVDGKHYKREESGRIDLSDWEYEDINIGGVERKLWEIYEGVPKGLEELSRLRVEVEDDGYGESYRRYYFVVTYLRPETEEERVAREEYELRSAREAEDRERAKYEALKARFGDD